MSAAMTVTEARERYSFLDRPAEWHRQPVCECGDYIAQHDEKRPHRCLAGVYGGIPIRCRCKGYRYCRMGSGDSGELPVPP